MNLETLVNGAKRAAENVGQRARNILLAVPVAVSMMGDAKPADAQTVNIEVLTLDQYQQPVPDVTVEFGGFTAKAGESPVIASTNNNGIAYLVVPENMSDLMRLSKNGHFTVEDSVTADGSWLTYVGRMPANDVGGWSINSDLEMGYLKEAKALGSLATWENSCLFQSIEDGNFVQVYFDPQGGAWTEAEKDSVGSRIGMLNRPYNPRSIGSKLANAGGTGRDNMYVEVFEQQNGQSGKRGLNIRKGSSYAAYPGTTTTMNGRRISRWATVELPQSDITEWNEPAYWKEFMQGANVWTNAESYAPSGLNLDPELPTARDIRHVNLIYDDRRLQAEIDQMPNTITHDMMDWKANSTLTDVPPHVAQSRLYFQPNFPEPFNPQTTIPIYMPATGSLQVDIYNVKGRLIQTLYAGHAEEGLHMLHWNGQDNQGNAASTGTYFAKGQSSGNSAVEKLILLK